MFPEKSVIYFGLDVACLLQSAAMVAKKLLVDDKTTACFKQICCYMLSSEGKTLSGETFCFLENVCHQYLNFVLQVTSLLFFTSCWLAHNQISWNVLLFSCNPIGHQVLPVTVVALRNVGIEEFQLDFKNHTLKWQFLLTGSGSHSGTMFPTGARQIKMCKEFKEN